MDRGVHGVAKSWTWLTEHTLGSKKKKKKIYIEREREGGRERIQNQKGQASRLETQ